MFVKPQQGLRVLWPDSKRPLPDAGAEVPDNFYWRRRLAQGDVVETSRTGAEETAP